MQAWPAALSGRDLVGIGKTGSGKTLAYLLPALIHIEHQDKLTKGDGPIALILVPSRELAQQVLSVTQKYAKVFNYKAIGLFCGKNTNTQSVAIAKGAEVSL